MVITEVTVPITHTFHSKARPKLIKARSNLAMLHIFLRTIAPVLFAWAPPYLGEGAGAVHMGEPEGQSKRDNR